jgi:hypothetical protein
VRPGSNVRGILFRVLVVAELSWPMLDVYLIYQAHEISYLRFSGTLLLPVTFYGTTTTNHFSHWTNAGILVAGSPILADMI